MPPSTNLQPAAEGQPATTKPTKTSFPFLFLQSPPNLLTSSAPPPRSALCNFKKARQSPCRKQTLAAAMAFLAPAAASLRAPIYVPAAASGRRSVLPAAVKATAGSGSATSSPHPILSSLRMAASAAVLLAATSPALACTPSAPPPTPLTATAHTEDPVQDASSSPFEKLIVETATLARDGGAEAARARLSAAGGDESYARLLAAQALFVDGKVDEAIAAFEELAREDPADYRPLFCQTVLYRVLGREAEAESMLERCREVGGDALFADPAILPTPAGAEAVDSESGAEEVEPEPAKV
ncbi:hypothetical protein HU200_008496 [Digitaria exilis]|uniref:Uncharacterized protein n=1 Tax=Digitaria exilis TaxID=1010633 RepID=A0A835FMF4_9POAL|nr:hypothetical protein HU200_008496 [Digitaria exilis]